MNWLKAQKLEHREQRIAFEELSAFIWAIHREVIRKG